MNIEEAYKIIQEEELDNFCLYCKENSNENETVIEKEVDNWVVYTNDEKATKTSIKYFLNESDALENFIKRLRGDKIFRENFKSL